MKLIHRPHRTTELDMLVSVLLNHCVDAWTDQVAIFAVDVSTDAGVTRREVVRLEAPTRRSVFAYLGY